MIRRYMAIAAVASLALSSVAQAAAPVRAGAAPVAARPLASLSMGDRVGVAKPEDSSQIFGSPLYLLLLLLAAAGVAEATKLIDVIKSSTPR